MSQCLADDETKSLEKDKKKRDECNKRYQKSNHGKQQWRMRGYKKEFMNSNPDTTLNYFVSNVVANGWIKIEDDEHPLYWVKANINLYAHVFKNKV